MWVTSLSRCRSQLADPCRAVPQGNGKATLLNATVDDIPLNFLQPSGTEGPSSFWFLRNRRAVASPLSARCKAGNT